MHRPCVSKAVLAFSLVLCGALPVLAAGTAHRSEHSRSRLAVRFVTPREHATERPREPAETIRVLSYYPDDEYPNDAQAGPTSDNAHRHGDHQHAAGDDQRGSTEPEPLAPAEPDHEVLPDNGPWPARDAYYDDADGWSVDADTVVEGAVVDGPFEEPTVLYETDEADWLEAPCDDCGVPGGATAGHGFRIGGWLAQGFTWNSDSPADRTNGTVTFNDRSNEYQMNQLYLYMERPVDRRQRRWDIGGRVDLLYGTDFRFTTARGLETDVAPNGQIRQRWNSDNRRFYGLAMPQLYMEVAMPLAAGTSVKLGHFYSPLGFESVMAPQNFFYSRSYSRQYGEPFTHTGFLVSMNVTDRLTLHGGMTRGWDTWEDNNNDLGQLYGASWQSDDRATLLGFMIHIGREQNEPPGVDNNRMVYSLVLQQRLADWLRYVVQHDLGFEDDAAGNNPLLDAQWASLNQYFLVDLTETLSLGFRAEWFRDGNGSRVARAMGASADYFAGTLGLNWRPCESVVIRPEVRYDFVEDDVQPFDDGTDRNQILTAVDVLLRY